MSLSNCRIVLVHTHYAGNLGATARVMRNFGLSDLVLVAPYAYTTNPEARRMARDGLSILDSARVVPELGDALADCVYSFATSSETAGIWRSGTTGSVAEKMPELFAASGAGPVAVVFGPEPHGLSNEQVSRCNGMVQIPVDAEYGSLNLAQAVAICCYELRKAWSKAENDARGRPEVPARSVAPFADQERMFEHLREAMTAIGYLWGEKADSLMHAIRHLVGRSQPTPQEVKLLHGLARQMLWAAKHIPGEQNGPAA
jgi:tRNA/rRNA methyltransferase